MKSLIDNIIAIEWNEFQKVENEGGRAACQDNRKTFEIARKSQFLSWNEEMLKSYFNDLTKATEEGRNLLTEKYARMMESTAPDKYEIIKDKLPAISDNMKKLIEDIIKIRIKWAEDFAELYPKISGNGRLIHSYEDNAYSTSSETYLRGELSTYSEKSIELYYEYVIKLQEQGKNQAMMIMENTAEAYGYKSLDEAENKLSNL